MKNLLLLASTLVIVQAINHGTPTCIIKALNQDMEELFGNDLLYEKYSSTDYNQIDNRVKQLEEFSLAFNQKVNSIESKHKDLLEEYFTSKDSCLKGMAKSLNCKIIDDKNSIGDLEEEIKRFNFYYTHELSTAESNVELYVRLISQGKDAEELLDSARKRLETASYTLKNGEESNQIKLDGLNKDQAKFTLELSRINDEISNFEENKRVDMEKFSGSLQVHLQRKENIKSNKISKILGKLREEREQQDHQQQREQREQQQQKRQQRAQELKEQRQREQKERLERERLKREQLEREQLEQRNKSNNSSENNCGQLGRYGNPSTNNNESWSKVRNINNSLNPVPQEIHTSNKNMVVKSIVDDPFNTSGSTKQESFFKTTFGKILIFIVVVAVLFGLFFFRRILFK